MPPSLQSFLPPSFRFDHDGYRLDWDHWTASDGPDATAKSGDFLAISVVIPDPRLASLVARRLGTKRLHYTVGNRSTIITRAPARSNGMFGGVS